ncbi:MAG: PepSY domain-containing protein [Anaerolineae bacterium]
MPHRTAFLVAAAMTVFVLILVGGVTATVAPKAVALNVSPTLLPTDTLAAMATAILTASPTATATETAKPTNTSVPQPTILLPDQALRIAYKLAPAAKLQKDPDLVNFKGKMAYEILFDLGAVYVDAFTGRVLFSTIGLALTPTPTPAVVVQASSGGGGGGGGGGGHGGGGGGQPQPNPSPAPSKGGGGSGGGGGGGGTCHEDCGGHGGGDH